MPEHVTVAIMQRDTDATRYAVNVGQCAEGAASHAASEALMREGETGSFSLLACLRPADVPAFRVRRLN